MRALPTNINDEGKALFDQPRMTSARPLVGVRDRNVAAFGTPRELREKMQQTIQTGKALRPWPE